ncbi:MAG: YpfJ protein zinc metalloprotease superfamily [Acidobacteria bacterium]|jgi:predicted metalloprotease|nr:YpfJ protein zinc metalloprotease superfamily [Acidobacteriota bacterium]
MLRGRESTNIEDVRGLGGKGLAVGGGGIGMLILALVIYLCGGDPQALLDNFTGQQGQAPIQQQQQQQNPNSQRADDDQRGFAASVLGSTEDVWNKVLPQQARVNYREPKLVLFTEQVSSACGYASSASGPFYCPGDEKLYLDFSFFRELQTEFKAPGDFAQAYVIAHEVGHHVQNILGTMDKVNAAGNNNQLSVRLELQADCYAGVWANYAQKQGLVEAGDAEEAMRAAAAVGDDAIQKRAQGYVVPESFTHGSARDRMTWFSRGFQSGDMRQCNTFGR